MFEGFETRVRASGTAGIGDRARMGDRATTLEAKPSDMEEFTDEEEGLPVVDINDNPVGVVSAVENGTAYVEFDPGFLDAIRSNLGIGAGGKGEEGAYPLREEMVDRVTDEKVRLRGDHVAG
jgi:hypothetical protein